MDKDIVEKGAALYKALAAGNVAWTKATPSTTPEGLEMTGYSGKQDGNPTKTVTVVHWTQGGVEAYAGAAVEGGFIARLTREQAEILWKKANKAASTS